MLVHHHMIIRAEVLNPPRDTDSSVEWFKHLVSYIGMKILAGPIVVYLDTPGNRGMTIAGIIETSHIVMHSWDESAPAIIQLDVYSCAPFEVSSVIYMLQEFDPIKIEYKLLDRETSLQELL